MLLILVSCKKNASEPDAVLVDLSIISTITPRTTTQGQEIVSNIKCSASNLCYEFLKFEIQETESRHFAIKAMATYPNPRKGNFACPQAIYYADTTLKIMTTTRGKYLLEFYNDNLLFKIDTVLVN